MTEIGIAELRENLAQVLEHVSSTREPIVVTKRGVAVATLVPDLPEQPESKPRFGLFKNGMTVAPGVDLSKPVMTDWEQEFDLKWGVGKQDANG